MSVVEERLAKEMVVDVIQVANWENLIRSLFGILAMASTLFLYRYVGDDIILTQVKALNERHAPPHNALVEHLGVLNISHVNIGKEIVPDHIII